jgi:acyl-CoA thioesterase YciA
MSKMDEAAGSAARGASGMKRFVTIKATPMTFDTPVVPGDRLSFYTRIKHVGTTSITVEVEATRRSTATRDSEQKVTRGEFVFVALDPMGKPRPIHGGILPWLGHRLTRVWDDVRTFGQHLPKAPGAGDMVDMQRGEPTILIEARHRDKNAAGNIFGGWLMSQMDNAAASAAAAERGRRYRTVRVEEMKFVSPVKVGHAVSVYTRIESQSDDAITIRVEAYRAAREEPKKLTKVTEATFTLRPIP